MTDITTHRSHPSTPQRSLLWARLTREVIGTFYDVYNELGFGFLEKVYRAALAITLEERGFSIRREVGLDVVFHGHCIGAYRADLIVNDTIIVEVKAGATLPLGSRAQLINYLRLSSLTVGLLPFFGPTPEFQRVVSSRSRHDGT